MVHQSGQDPNFRQTPPESQRQTGPPKNFPPCGDRKAIQSVVFFFLPVEHNVTCRKKKKHACRPEQPVDAVERQGGAEPLEAAGVEGQAVDALEEGLHVGGALLLLPGARLLDGPLDELLDAAAAEVAQGALHRVHHAVLRAQETRLGVTQTRPRGVCARIFPHFPQFTMIASSTATVSWLSNFLLFVNQ